MMLVIIFAVMALVLAFSAIKVVSQGYQVTVERFGRWKGSSDLFRLDAEKHDKKCSRKSRNQRSQFHWLRAIATHCAWPMPTASRRSIPHWPNWLSCRS